MKRITLVVVLISLFLVVALAEGQTSPASNLRPQPGTDRGLVSNFTMARAAIPGIKETTLHIFAGNTGYFPEAGLVRDSSGNLYGTTVSGGDLGYGVVYELSPNGSGGWTYSLIYQFTGREDGIDPTGNLTFDSEGNLYGITAAGATNNHGAVFELSPSGNGVWTLTRTYDFTGGQDGGDPAGSVVLDSAGNVYGLTAEDGNKTGKGTVFKLTPSGNTWTEQTLHIFSGPDGYPGFGGSVILDRGGNIYGTTTLGGHISSNCNQYGYGCGVVFKLTHAHGDWTETVLYRFRGSNGADFSPNGPLLLDKKSRLYGTTQGSYNGGGVFRLSPPQNAPAGAEQAWDIGWLYRFCSRSGCSDGSSPQASVVFDNAGNLYGTAEYGGKAGGTCGSAGCGVVYKLTPTLAPGWTESVLYAFRGTDGMNSIAPVLLDNAGDLYGTTFLGGSSDVGVIFGLTP
jgi:uncharacterized repeat protein (TIGR03803 family)